MSRDFITNISIHENELSNLLNKLPEGDPQAASDFFARFGLSQMYYNNRFYETLERGHEVLHLCSRLCPGVFNWIHKGYPLYWMGMAAYRIHDFQSAIYYIDATLSEDRKNFPSDSNTPPHLFLRLEGEDDRQAAKSIVQGAQKSIDDYIDLYNQILKKSGLFIPMLKIEHIRSSLLKLAVSSNNPDIRSLASTFITFFLEFKYREFQLSLRSEPGTNEPFFIHLFKGCLLFESLLRNNPTKITEKNELSALLTELGNELGFAGKQFKIGGVRLPQVLKEAMNADDLILNSIVITGKLRNTIGHNLGWSTQLLREQYINSFLHIGFSCLHAIATLYRKGS